MLAVEDVPGFGTDVLELLIDPTGIATPVIERCQRTFEASRHIEFAAIAIAGLGLHMAGNHELVDVARRGSAADYRSPPSFGDRRTARVAVIWMLPGSRNSHACWSTASALATCV